MNPALKNFYDNEVLREAVKAFLLEELHNLAVERVFGKQTVAGIYEGKKVIDKAFDKLGVLYGKIDKPVIHNSR